MIHPQIVLIYWGAAWANASTSPSQSQFTSALTDIMSGPWGIQLNQYHGIGPLSLEQEVQFTTTEPPTGFVESDVKNFVDARINAGDVPAPATAVDRVYCVLMPTGHSPTDNPNFAGRHQAYTRPDGTPVYYSWITNDGSMTDHDSIPKVFSHEIAEACTDPNVSSGITLNSDGDEIGDVCNNTFQTVNGHAEESYWSQADTRCVTPILQGLPATKGIPALIQSRFGQQGNFELVVPVSGLIPIWVGVMHIWRNDDSPFLPWSAPTATFGQSFGGVDAVTMIQSNYGSPGNLEVVARVGSDLHAFWRDSGPAFDWHGPYQIISGVSGDPILVQSRFGQQGNFELVVPSNSGGLVHWWRANDDPGMPWNGPTHFAQGLGQVDTVTMIQSNYGSPGNLEVVARVGSNLHALWRDSGPSFNWSDPSQIIGGVTGNPVLVQSRFGQQGNFELVVPSSSGGIVHWWRSNDDPNMPWIGPTATFGQGLGNVEAVTMIQSNYGSPGNLEVVARVGWQLFGFWRDSGPAFNWNGPSLLQATVW